MHPADQCRASCHPSKNAVAKHMMQPDVVSGVGCRNTCQGGACGLVALRQWRKLLQALRQWRKLLQALRQWRMLLQALRRWRKLLPALTQRCDPLLSPAKLCS